MLWCTPKDKKIKDKGSGKANRAQTSHFAQDSYDSFCNVLYCKYCSQDSVVVFLCCYRATLQLYGNT